MQKFNCFFMEKFKHESQHKGHRLISQRPDIIRARFGLAWAASHSKLRKFDSDMKIRNYMPAIRIKYNAVRKPKPNFYTPWVGIGKHFFANFISRLTWCVRTLGGQGSSLSSRSLFMTAPKWRLDFPSNTYFRI